MAAEDACAGRAVGAEATTVGAVLAGATATGGALGAVTEVFVADTDTCGAGLGAEVAGGGSVCAAAGCPVVLFPAPAFCALTAAGTAPVPGAPISGNTVPCCRLPNLGWEAEACGEAEAFAVVADAPFV